MTEFDKEKALKYGADKYGMRKYVMAFLKRGTNRPADPDKANELQRAHLDNIGKMAEAGKLVIAGPFLDNGDLRGIYIFNVISIEEAEELTKTDPAIIYGSLIMELKEWYGSAALMAVNDIHKEIAEEEI
ncbi:MAG TPA: YciI family protein [Clostridiales bacterium]|nr:YciI family protein [Clostridiales bacterium]